MKPRLAIITTHPIQYYAPIFRQIQSRGRIDCRVFYTWGDSSTQKFDPGFGQVISWDIPLLDGYDYEFLDNQATDPGTHRFMGIRAPKAFDRVKSWNPTHLLVIGWSWYTHLELMIRFHGKIPVLFRGDSHLLDPVSPLKNLLRQWFLAGIYRFTDVALAVGTNNEAYFRWVGMKNDQIRRVPHAIDNERFANLSKEQDSECTAWKQQLGITEGQVVFLFAGKFQRKKGIFDLITAFSSIPDPSIRLILIGSGDEYHAIMDSIKSDARIQWLPFQNQSRMPLVYRLASWFVYPSHGPGETWGLAVNEAMAAGIPCLVSDRVGCATDLISAGETGYVFPTGDASALSSAMRLVIKDHTHWPERQEACRNKIAPYSIHSIATGIEEAVLK